jgi:hypothetical protein
MLILRNEFIKPIMQMSHSMPIHQAATPTLSDFALIAVKGTCYGSTDEVERKNSNSIPLRFYALSKFTTLPKIELFQWATN